jgi:hypothetical protein
MTDNQPKIVLLPYKLVTTQPIAISALQFSSKMLNSVYYSTASCTLNIECSNEYLDVNYEAED